MKWKKEHHKHSVALQTEGMPSARQSCDTQTQLYVYKFNVVFFTNVGLKLHVIRELLRAMKFHFRIHVGLPFLIFSSVIYKIFSGFFTNLHQKNSSELRSLQRKKRLFSVSEKVTCGQFAILLSRGIAPFPCWFLVDNSCDSMLVVSMLVPRRKE